MEIGKVRVWVNPTPGSDCGNLLLNCYACDKPIPLAPYVIDTLEDLVGLAEEHECEDKN